MSRSSIVRNDVDESSNSRNQSNDVFRPPNIWTIIVEHPLWIIGFSFFAFILLINIPINLVTSPFRKPAPDAKTTQNREPVTRAAVGAATHPDQVLFDRAKEAMRQKRFDIANLELQTLLNTYPSSKFAGKAKALLNDPQIANCGQFNTTPEKCNGGTQTRQSR